MAAFTLSVVAYYKSRKVSKVEEKLNEYDLKLKQYELEKIELEKNSKEKPKVEARIINISRGNYIIKIWNSGEDTAFNVDYDIPRKYNITPIKKVTPFERLEPGKYFEESVMVHMQSSKKFEIITNWQDKNHKDYTHKELMAR